LFPDQASPGVPAFTRDGRLTDEGLAALHSHMPYADLSDLEHDRRLNGLDDLFTVGLLANYIEWKLSRGGPWPAGAFTPSPSTQLAP
jgi:hypothetical protein